MIGKSNVVRFIRNFNLKVFLDWISFDHSEINGVSPKNYTIPMFLELLQSHNWRTLDKEGINGIIELTGKTIIFQDSLFIQVEKNHYVVFKSYCDFAEAVKLVDQKIKELRYEEL